ncbi:hypothetical protein RHMOL_Rhmol13G0269400 [Rhododendron molle]|uniref:Uncharacterized protein n=1 Tax=Rhododendron molle TaxID=49168 RepID=A0ACC0LCF0_RHOML|nr:hypothetical protein RHMOL_Rhmol13G0269400 [Rhododendron molle]
MGVSLALGRLSIAYGMVEELGPFHIEKDEKTLCLNPYAWNQAWQEKGVHMSLLEELRDLSSPSHLLLEGQLMAFLSAAGTRGTTTTLFACVLYRTKNLRAKATLLSYGILETPDLYNEVL